MDYVRNGSLRAEDRKIHGSGIYLAINGCLIVVDRNRAICSHLRNFEKNKMKTVDINKIQYN
jgi:hypothetical protein